MADPRIVKKSRNLPHWTLEGSTYFVTFQVHQGSLDDAEKAIVLAHIRSGEPQFYNLPGVVIMPDHVHLLVKPIPPYSLSRIMKGIKGVSARKINAYRQTTGTVWQDES